MLHFGTVGRRGLSATKPRRAIFRCEATPEIGDGHLVRCRCLADSLRSRGWAVAFSMSEASSAAAADLRAAGYEVRDAIETARPTEPPAALLVVDHYGIDATVERGLRAWARQVLVMDDLANRPHDADVLIDPTYGRTPADYAGLVPASCTLLLGSDYAIVRDAYRQRRDASLAWRLG